MLSQTETERTHAVLFNSNPIFAPSGAWPVGIFAGARSFHGPIFLPVTGARNDGSGDQEEPEWNHSP